MRRRLAYAGCAYAQGIRAFDTSAAYQSEPDFKDWFQQEPAVRKEVFVVTKEHEVPGIASKLRPMIDERCAAMGTDYVDLFFFHSFGDDGIDASLKLLKSKELKVAADAAKESAQDQAIWTVDSTTAIGPRSSGPRLKWDLSTRSWCSILPGSTRSRP